MLYIKKLVFIEIKTFHELFNCKYTFHMKYFMKYYMKYLRLFLK